MIVLFPFGGLCNRMRAISNIYTIAESLNEKLIVIWQCSVGSGVVCQSKLLFDLPKDITVIDVVNTSRLRRCIFNRLLIPVIKKLSKNYIDGIMSREMKKQGKEAIYSYFETNRKKTIFIETGYDITKEKTINIFYPKEKINQKVKQLKKQLSWNDEDIVGVHIRRTDNTVACNESPTDCFVYEIEKRLDERTKFYVASDSNEEIDIIKKKYGNKVLVFEGKRSERYTVEGEMDAYVELLMLASCREIIGSHYSSYSEVASQIGDIKLCVAHRNSNE